MLKLSKFIYKKNLKGGVVMVTTEELFRRAKKHQQSSLRKINFWQALWAILDEIVYYGGAHIEFDGKIYTIKTDYDAISLLLEIYDSFKNQ